ncbi:MAG: ankyrin repeat domain-containing protein [Pseudomonadota bacterium]
MSKKKPIQNKVTKIQIGVRDEQGWAPIHLAASSGREISVVSFARDGADVNMLIESGDGFNGMSPAILAVQGGHVETLLALARLGADLDIKVNGMSAAMFAIQHKTKSVALTKTLIAMGADFSLLKGAVDKHGAEILLQLGVSQEYFEELVYIISNPEEVKSQYELEHNVSPIIFKDSDSKEEELDVEEEIDIGKSFGECDIDAVVKYVQDSSIPEENKYGANLFVAAAAQRSTEYTKMMVALIRAGYDISRADGEGVDAYVRLKSLDAASGVALCLLGANANTDISAQINAIGEDGMNDVHRAIIAGKEQTLSVLLACGGDLNLPMSNGPTPMMLAMKSKVNMSEMFYILVKNGADVSVYDMQAVKDLAEGGVIIDPETVKYLQAAKSGKLFDSEMESLIIDKSFWQKVPLLDLEQVSVLIAQFKEGQKIDIDQMLAPKMSEIALLVLENIDYTIAEQDDQDVKVFADTNDSSEDL